MSYNFFWWRDACGFSVKSIFSSPVSLFADSSQIDQKLANTFEESWKSNVPSNIQVFVGILFLNMLKTIDELAKRGIIVGIHDLVCPLSLGPKESHCHLFIRCPKAVLV